MIYDLWSLFLEVRIMDTRIFLNSWQSQYKESNCDWDK